MASGAATKFGMFGGVFTPSILTILGVIMYLRLPWLVGSAGLTMALIVIFAAHLISVTTGLSISSIATDKKVGAGGPYYIVSRSMGLPIGGTLGLALFVGLSFSISLYVIGFVESALPWFANLDIIKSSWDIPIDGDGLKNSTRIAGTIVVTVLAIITMISTSLTIKTQYIILVAIIASLFSIFLGSGAAAPEVPTIAAPEGAANFAVFFGIFFPAVTGFTAGVNMSGDLKDPKRALPRGTMLAISVGFLVYVGLAVFLAYKIDPALLREDSNILVTFAGPFAAAVFAGIWGATISSALGSLLGAPRILQALANDGVMPRFLGKGAGPSEEPRRALMVALLIAEGGILIGELDAIARVVSIFFIATYGFLNIAAAIESWASSDFHPDFKIPKTVSVIGAVACLIVMVLLDLVATMGATLLFAAAFTVLKRRELTLESGDTWEGVWSSLVRAGVERLQHVPRLERNWRPNILAIPSTRGDPTPLIDFGEALIRDRGVITALDFAPATDDGLDDRAVGVFKKRVDADTPEERTAAGLAAVQFHGFAGLEPNTIMLDWRERVENPDGLRKMLKRAAGQDYNVLALAPDDERGLGEGKRIDVWWTQGRGALGLCINLIRFLRTADAWRGASLRFLFVTDESTPADALLKSTQRLLEHARVTADVKVIDNGMANRPFEKWVEKESAEADLVLLGLPEADASDEELESIDFMLSQLGTTLFVRASSAFQDTFGGERRSLKAAAREVEDADLPEVVYPEQGDLAQAARALHLPLEECVARFTDDCLQTVVLQTGGLLEGVSASLMKELSNLEKEAERTEAPRHAKALAKARSSALFQAQRLLDDYEAQGESRGHVIERQLELLQERLDEIHGELPKKLHVLRDKEDLAPRREDKAAVRSGKARLRRRNLFRKTASYTIDARGLHDALLDGEIVRLTRDVLHDAASRTFQTVLDLGRELEDLRRRMAELGESEGGLDAELLRKEKDRALEVLSSLADRNYTVLARAKRDMVGGTRDLVRGYIDDISAFDYQRRAKARRLPEKETADAKSNLSAAPEKWAHNERLLIGRVSLTLQSASISLRLTSIVRKSRDALVRQLSERASARLKTIQSTLTAFLEADAPDAATLRLVVENLPELDDKAIVDDLVAEMQSAAANLPESFDTLSDESILVLREAPFASVDTLHVSLRRLAEFLIVGEFSEALGRELTEVPSREQRAVEVARDVARLVSMHAYDDDVSLDGAPIDEDEEAEGIEDVVKGALARVTSELEVLDELRARARERFDTHLRRVLDRTDAYAISGSEEGVRPYIRRELSTNKALSRVSRRIQSAQGRVRDSLVALLYRRSRGQLLARRLRREEDPENIVERTLHLVAEASPPPAVLSGLPFHYRQLFIGQTRISNEFWVGRGEELAEAARAVARFRDGTRGAIFVTGARGSGKSALCRQLISRNFRGENVHHVFPPVEGSVDVNRFNARVAGELGGRGDLERTIAALEGNAVVCLHDLELWWRRAGDGLAVVEHVARLIERYGDRCLFVINLGDHALRFISKLTPLAEHALAVIRCRPVDAEALKEIVLRRHRSTGLSFELRGTAEDQLAPWEEAQLFSRLFDHTSGSIGAALHAWLSHIERIDGDTVYVSRARPLVSDVLSGLRVEWIALLVQLLLHRRASLARMQAITGIALGELERDLATLARMRLVSEVKPNVFELNRWASPMVARHLEERRVLG
jgi:amino acid transporter